MLKTLKFVSLSLVIAGCASCRRESIRIYDAPKEHAAAAMQLPEGWKQLPADQMSVAKFVVRGEKDSTANISISMFPPSDELANVNRWRRQAGLEPIAAEQAAKERETIQIAGQPAALFDIAGTAADSGNKIHIIAAIQNRGDGMWFFKMSGDEALVTSQKTAFTQFLARFPIPGEAQPPLASAKVPPSAPEATPLPEHKWNAPNSWTEQPPGPMQDAKYSVAGGKATVTISILPGQAGGLRANIDRWRNQLGLAPATDAEFEKAQAPLDLPDAKATVVDMTGTSQRMVTVIIRRGEQTWFVKLFGETPAVESEKKAFLEFVKTTK